MRTAQVTPAQVEGLTLCMQHWCLATEDALYRAHDRRATSAQRLEALRLSSRAEVRAGRLLTLLRRVETTRFMQEAA